MVADIEVSMKTGKIVAKHLYISHVNGVSVNPDLVANQAEGAAIQGLSRALYERLAFTKDRITSIDWVTYPILRIKDTPKVTVGDRLAGRLRRSTRRAAARTCRRATSSAFNAGWAIDRCRRAADGTGGGRGRERVLRRHGCAHP